MSDGPKTIPMKDAKFDKWLADEMDGPQRNPARSRSTIPHDPARSRTIPQSGMKK